MTAAPGIHETDRPPTDAPTAIRTLYRSRTNRTFAGVCGGLAEYLGADPTAVRLLTVIAGILTGIVPFLLLYLIAAVIVPERPGGVPADPSAGIDLAPGRAGLVVGVVLVAVGLLALTNRLFAVEWDVLWPVALVVLGGALMLSAQRR